MAKLDDLGPRICIFGPSNSGKSTLAAAIATARGLPPIHLDQLFHLPHTNWQPRPAGEFIRLHDEAITGEAWVIEGNYSRCIPQRLARATGLILLDLPTIASLYRYLRRSWFESDRPGTLAGGKDSVKWSMIHHIAGPTRQNRKKYFNLFKETPLPKTMLPTARDLARFYKTEGLRR